MSIQSFDPYKQEIIGTFKEMNDSEIEEILERSAKEFANWKLTSFDDRKVLINRYADILESKLPELAVISVSEVGKTITAAQKELEKCVEALHFYAENSEKYLQSISVKTEARESYVTFEPLGTILSVMPWNFPYWQVLRVFATIIMSGNTLILKHSSNVPRCALAMERIADQAGFPKGLFQVIFIDATKIETIIRDPRIKGVTLTGSDHAGSNIAQLAGKYIKPSVLELGGSDPFIVYSDVNDLSRVVGEAVKSRTQNNGQVCNSAKRFIVHTDIYKRFVEMVKVKFEKLKIGDPLDPSTDIGPIANVDALNTLKATISDALSKGAVLVTGGIEGNFCKPTILINVTQQMSVCNQEVFGPIVPIIPFTSDEEMITIANATPFGLGASIWTDNLERVRKIIPLIEAGNVYINKTVTSHFALPFGGIKRSGYGREMSEFGIRSFMNIKTVWIN